MKRILLTFLLGCVICSVCLGQTLLEQIERAYSGLDTASYIDQVILSFTNQQQEGCRRTFTSLVDALCKANDSLHVRKQRISKLIKDFENHKMSDANDIKQFEREVKYRTPIYVLNLKLKDERTLETDTGKLAFNLFYFGKKYKKGTYVYCNEGKYDGKADYFFTLSPQIAKNAPKAFKKVLRKHPKHLLLCNDLEGTNTFLYEWHNQIYVYRIVEMREYTLNDYMNDPTIRRRR